MTRSFLQLVGTSVVMLLAARGAYATSSCSACPGDLNGDNQVTVDEILTAVNSALNGCPPVSTQKSSLLQTGQAQCDQGTGALGVCPGSPLQQDAAVGAGVALSYVDNGNGTVTDKATGLTWEKLSRDGSVHDYTRTYTWSDAFSVKVAALNTAPCFANFCDWRLPNRRELESLVDLGQVIPAVDPVFNTACQPSCKVTACSCTAVADFAYWSSSSYQDPGSPGAGWTVDFYVGIVNGFDKSIPNYVRAVRGGL